MLLFKTNLYFVYFWGLFSIFGLHKTVLIIYAILYILLLYIIYYFII